MLLLIIKIRPVTSYCTHKNSYMYICTYIYMKMCTRVAFYISWLDHSIVAIWQQEFRERHRKSFVVSKSIDAVSNLIVVMWSIVRWRELNASNIPWTFECNKFGSHTIFQLLEKTLVSINWAKNTSSVLGNMSMTAAWQGILGI